jgi:CRISPR-associated exonuclease Cas4
MIPLSLLLLAAALVVLWLASRQRKVSGLPAGRVVYSDTQGWGRVEKPLYDAESGVTGKPDYLVEQDGGAILIPVEVKSARAPSMPYDSHVFQLAAYCLLVERTYGQRPPYGLLRYRDKTFAIDYTPAMEQELLDLLEQMRSDSGKPASRAKSARQKEGLARSHEEPARCARCGYRQVCDQRL